VLRCALVFTGVAAAVHLASLWALPRLIMARVANGLPLSNHTPYLPPQIDATSRQIVMPSPDMLYALCKLDLRQGPVTVSAKPLSPDYWSIALYDNTSDHFHVINDRQAAGEAVQLTVSFPSGAKAATTSGRPAAGPVQTVQASSPDVLVLMRLLMRDRSPETLAQREQDRSTLRCQPGAGVAVNPGTDTANAPGDLSGEFARRGLIARPTGQVRDASGQVLWDYDSFDFLQGPAPDTVHPSLWRHALLNNQTGLFKVTDRIWQLRGFDLANMTLIEGETGWIVVDPLTTRETASAALAFAERHLGKKPVSAVIFTHSHVDHFGGVLGVLSAQEAVQRGIPIIAPVGFMEEATSENLMVGMAMARRSFYMYGSQLARSPTGLVDNGLGKAVPYGSFGILPPTRLIEKPVESVTVDGMQFVFHNVPGSEAPAEFVFFLPQLKAFGGAELYAHTLHNIYTLRGAKVRDALKWSRYMDETRVYAEQSDVMFNQHNWPIWGRDAILDHIGLQRDVYRFLHDQTVRLMNKGLNAAEIAETLRLPPVLDAHLNTRGYYGTVRHNIKGIYQFYLGWYDGNPANLDPLPPVEAAKGYVQLAGGIDQLLAQIAQAQAAGNHRWAAELGKHAVYGAPENKRVKDLMAKSLEHLGYQSEASTWRNAYLTGAQELRKGSPDKGVGRKNFLDMLLLTPVERFLESMAASLNPQRAQGMELRINLVFTDTQETHALHLRNSILNHEKVSTPPPADATLNLTKAFFISMLTGEAGAAALLSSADTKIEGSTLKLAQFFRLLDKPSGLFDIVTR
jgi:alkyl sulfatase BDS1-like metallo-beta-lactamase superfamily hydrolase/uncharacterized membrane protein